MFICDISSGIPCGSLYVTRIALWSICWHFTRHTFLALYLTFCRTACLMSDIPFGIWHFIWHMFWHLLSFYFLGQCCITIALYTFYFLPDIFPDILFTHALAAYFVHFLAVQLPHVFWHCSVVAVSQTGPVKHILSPYGSNWGPVPPALSWIVLASGCLMCIHIWTTPEVSEFIQLI